MSEIAGAFSHFKFVQRVRGGGGGKVGHICRQAGGAFCNKHHVELSVFSASAPNSMLLKSRVQS